MITAARARAALEPTPPDFLCASAQTHPFPPAAYDLLLSRFGVMFFPDPVLAFTNLRRAAAPRALLHAIAWRAPSENSFMTTAERAAAPFLPDLPPRRPDAPGQFAFADPSRVHTILDASGWTDIALHPLDVPCTLPEPALLPYLTRLGPVGVALQHLDAPARARILPTLRAAFDPFVHGPNVHFTAACWTITARAPSTPPLPQEAATA
ncbi:Methyltransferase [Chondromyces apiculatus DSM 436]|uniref:Methyltransferase n=2 Tax=Chondromyces apiculatus TaxID=51 RepID=A0A017SUN0_9BACT|nr:Methyltransferase [Chondromyces apiculatus DSM 436]